MPGVLQRPLKLVYEGKFVDRAPQLKAAGKLVPLSSTASECLKEIQPRPITPAVVKKFTSSSHPKPGAIRVFYGKANDPVVPLGLSHGIISEISDNVKTLVNPPIRTWVQQNILNEHERLYSTNQRAPLGKSYDQASRLPKGVDVYKTTFGKKLLRDITARELVNPQKSWAQVDKEAQEGHPLYVLTHNDYKPEEQVDRKYSWTRCNKYSTFGIQTPHFNDGRNIKKPLNWLQEEQLKKGAKIISKKLANFREKTQHQLGKGLDPIADTMRVSPDHTFGVLLHPDEYGVEELIHYRNPDTFVHGNRRHKSIFNAARLHLKNANFLNFHSLLEGFRHYDKNGDGKIDREELRDVFLQFKLDLEPALIDELIQYCDQDGDGTINFLEFANFLNHKDRMPLGKLEEAIITKDHLSPECVPMKDALVEPGDVVPIDIGSSIKTLRTVPKVKDWACDEFRTSASEINAVVGGRSTVNDRAYGIPTIRTDIPAPRFRSISDRVNYGDESNAQGLLNPTIFAQRGVYEKDIFMSRSKSEIVSIFCAMGVDLPKESFDQVWELAAQKHPEGKVCVETFRNVLDEMQASYILSC
ncbi:EF-hand domain-containing family member B isoform X1 [Callorhinchus milii]|uniref:EF-hand domain-containing family member B isoform X1 n=1 Tax=Callorhinchus milii TaxID=7868 RepID=UPI001C3FCC0A|nr:EF-hand domain-containing family member B isoform X1 [Callorhinchus milii]